MKKKNLFLKLVNKGKEKDRLLFFPLFLFIWKSMSLMLSTSSPRSVSFCSLIFPHRHRWLNFPWSSSSVWYTPHQHLVRPKKKKKPSALWTEVVFTQNHRLGVYCTLYTRVLLPALIGSIKDWSSRAASKRDRDTREHSARDARGGTDASASLRSCKYRTN